MINKQFIDRRRLIPLAAMAVPAGLCLGILISELTWEAPEAIAIPEMCITAEPTGETSVSLGDCPVEELEGSCLFPSERMTSRKKPF